MDEPFYTSPFPSPTGEPMLCAWRSAADGSYRLRHWDGLVCTVSADGQRIAMTVPDLSAVAPQARRWAPDPEAFLAGTGLALSWRLRGELCLHAAAVNVDGRAVLLAGPSGAGKSTIAAALALRGYRVIADDLVVVSSGGDVREVQPGRPRLRLRPHAVALVEDFAGRSLPWTTSPCGAYVDLNLDAAADPATAPTPIEAICFLSQDPSTAGRLRMAAIGGADAAMALISDSWASRLQDRALRQQEFEQTARLVDAVRVMQVHYHLGCGLNAVANLIEHEAARIEVAPS